jgi:hypothetical protein
MRKFGTIELINSADLKLFKYGMISAFLWLSIVFIFRKIFIYLSWNLFLLGILPNFFAAITVYLLLTLKYKSKPKGLLGIFAFVLLAIPEVIQLYTPRTFDPLDLVASAIGIGVAQLVIIIVNRQVKGDLNLKK